MIIVNYVSGLFIAYCFSICVIKHNTCKLKLFFGDKHGMMRKNIQVFKYLKKISLDKYAVRCYKFCNYYYIQQLWLSWK